MKVLIALVFFSLVACASCDREDEDFTPFPGGKMVALNQTTP